MSSDDRVLAFLRSTPSGAGCDDCISGKARIKPRQEVSRTCRKLVADGKLVRRRAKCPLGNHTKVVNSLVATPARGSRTTAAPRKRSAASTAAAATLGIEDAWRFVDRFCKALWVKHLKDDPPVSLAECITALRDQELVPAHEANMMHNIRSLRNMLVHENVNFGGHETAIAQASWEIIRAWAQRREDEAWRLTVSVCIERAA